jgi:hypothetical protein
MKRWFDCIGPLALGTILLAGNGLNAASAAPLRKRLSSLAADCRSLALKEKRDHGVDKLAQLPSVCASLGKSVRARAAGSRNPALQARFKEAYQTCRWISRHRGAMFTYRGHPGNPDMYRSVLADCEAYANAFYEAANSEQGTPLPSERSGTDR